MIKLHNKINFKAIFRYIILFILYGVLYFIIETVWKCKITDIRMLFLGGILGITIGMLNNIFTYDTDFIIQCLLSSLLVTISEAILGYYWNIENGLNIWSYSNLPFSAIDGQINLLFSIGWLLLSGVCIVVDDVINYYIFDYKKDTPPYYKVFGKVIFRMKQKQSTY